MKSVKGAIGILLLTLLLTSCAAEKSSSTNLIETIGSTIMIETFTFESSLETQCEEIYDSDPLIEITDADETISGVIETTEQFASNTAEEIPAVTSTLTSETTVYSLEPDMSVLHNGNRVNEYELDGYGTVYGYYLPTNICELINEYRNNHGLNELPIMNIADEARAYSILAATRWFNGLSAHGANEEYFAIHTGGGYDNFVASPEHFAVFNGEWEQQVAINGMSSVRFVYCVWNGSEWIEGSNCATVVFY